jgi:hypothetical protein
MDNNFSFSFNQEAASDANNGGKGISASGFYDVTINEAQYIEQNTNNNLKKVVEFSLETEDGKTANFVQLMLWTQNKGDHYQAKQLHALLGLLRLNGVTTSKIGDKTVFGTLTGKRITVGLQKELYTNKNGEEKYKFNVVGFCDLGTKQTFDERANNKEAKFYTYEIIDVDKRSSTSGSFGGSSFGGAPKVPTTNNKSSFPDDDLPF